MCQVAAILDKADLKSPLCDIVWAPDTQIYVSSSDLSFKLQTNSSNCPPDCSTWTSNRLFESFSLSRLSWSAIALANKSG